MVKNGASRRRHVRQFSLVYRLNCGNCMKLLQADAAEAGTCWGNSG